MDVEETGKLYTLTLEANLVLSPVDHFGFLVGIFYDVGLGGSFEQDVSPSSGEELDEAEMKMSVYGLHAGLVGWL